MSERTTRAAGRTDPASSEWSAVMSSTSASAVTDSASTAKTSDTTDATDTPAGSSASKTVTVAAATARVGAVLSARAGDVRRRLDGVVGEGGSINTAWVLPAMLLVVCVLALAWFFAHGTAAMILLIALIVVLAAGVPLGLLALKALGYEDTD